MDGLLSCGVDHRRGLCGSLRVASAGFCSGARPARPGPSRRGASAVVLQVLGGAGWGCAGVPRPEGVPDGSSPLPGCGYRSVSAARLLSRPVGPGWAVVPGSCGGAVAWWALGARGRVCTASRSTRPPPCGREGAVTRGSPAGARPRRRSPGPDHKEPAPAPLAITCRQHPAHHSPGLADHCTAVARP